MSGLFNKTVQGAKCKLQSAVPRYILFIWLQYKESSMVSKGYCTLNPLSNRLILQHSDQPVVSVPKGVIMKEPVEAFKKQIIL